MITKPTLLIDKKKCKRNIEMMFLKAKINNVVFRPHFKTHQSLDIGQWFKELGVDKITVSSLEMAQYFSSEWKDISNYSVESNTEQSDLIFSMGSDRF
jgi:D-serine deaminase-like pyridoxal phosphate-dependent protein